MTEDGVNRLAKLEVDIKILAEQVARLAVCVAELTDSCIVMREAIEKHLELTLRNQ